MMGNGEGTDRWSERPNWRASENREGSQDCFPEVPESEIQVDFARSGGPGGQNVNKVNSKAIVRWSIVGSGVFTDEQKSVLLSRLHNRVNNEGEVVIAADAERSQHQNRANAVDLLQKLVAEALEPEKKRVPTKPSRRQKRKRVEEKRKLGQKKKERRKPRDGWE